MNSMLGTLQLETSRCFWDIESFMKHSFYQGHFSRINLRENTISIRMDTLQIIEQVFVKLASTELHFSSRTVLLETETT